MKKYRYTRNGQVGIIVVLVGVVIFTLGMATASRVTTDIQIASRSEDGSKALAAAEAVMEIAMDKSRNLSIPANRTLATDWVDQTAPTSVQANFVATPIPEPGVDDTYTIGTIAQGEAQTVWLTDADTIDIMSDTQPSYNDSFTIQWRRTAGDEVEITTLYQTQAPVHVAVHREYITGNQNTVTINTAIAVGAAFNRNFLVRIRAIRGDGIQNVTIGTWTDPFPTQAYHIVADAHTFQNDVRRRIEATRLVGNIPEFMDYVMFSQGDLIKNN